MPDAHKTRLVLSPEADATIASELLARSAGNIENGQLTRPVQKNRRRIAEAAATGQQGQAEPSNARLSVGGGTQPQTEGSRLPGGRRFAELGV